MKIKENRILFSAEDIAARVASIGRAINTDYAEGSLVMICVLKGAFMFFSDLVKHVTIRPEIDFVRIASYGDGTATSRTISFTKDVEISLEGKHVLLVEDIVDSGHSMDFLVKQLTARGAKSIHIAALVDKRERREVAIETRYQGFIINEGFIVGYGLDYAEQFRELPAIHVLTLEE